MIHLRGVTLSELAARFGGVVDDGAEAIAIEAVTSIDARAHFALVPVLRAKLAAAPAWATALLVAKEIETRVPRGKRWVHEHAAWALAKVLEEAQAAWPSPSYRHEAFIDRYASVHETARIGPRAVIFAGSIVGEDARVEANAVLYPRVSIGARSIVGAGAVVGREGFGFATSPDGRAVRIPQLGGVVVEDDVEIGALCTIDAGTLGPTIVERGAKLDAHVHVGHNGRVGAGARIAAQAGFAGSVEIGRGVLVGGQAGVADHVRIGDGARLAAKSGVISDVSPRATVAGYPAVARARWLRAMAKLFGRGSRGVT